MSGDKISATRPSLESNEEIIQELTSNLKATCIPASEEDLTSTSSSQSSPMGPSSSSTEENIEYITKPDKESMSKETKDEDDTIQDNAVNEDDTIDEEAMKEDELSLTEEEKLQRKNDAEAAKVRGNEQFKNSLYKESIVSYVLALRTCPLQYKNDRSILYSNRAASKMKLGLKESAVEDCTKALELNPTYVKAYCRRAQLYEQTEKLDECFEDYKKILELDPSHNEARAASVRLPPIIAERNEKLKTEMLGKLKDLGNMILKPFGLSTSNFQMQQDPNSGGYSINFNQNK